MAVKMTKLMPRLIRILAVMHVAVFSDLASSQISRAQMVQSDIEKLVKTIVGSQLTESEYFVYAKVKLEEKPSGEGAGSDKFLNLPYSPIKVEKDYLEDMLRRNQGQYPKLIELSLTLVFDQKVPQEKVDLLTSVVRERFEINDGTRKLDVRSLSLVTAPVQSQEERWNLERSKLDNEKALIELKSQREKFEMVKREEELKKKIADLEAAKKDAANLPEQEKVKEKDEEKTPVNPTVVTSIEKPKSTLDYLESFQLLIFAAVAGLVLMIVTLLSGGVVKKGLQPMAEAIGKIGDGVGNMSTAAATAGASGPAPIDPIKAAEKAQIAEQASIPVPSGTSDDKSLDEFLEGVSEKLKILIAEKNFAFYRHFCDMIDSPSYRKMAAAIMLSIEESNVASLLNGVSPEHIELLKDFLSRPGAVAEAQSLKKAALQEFFGRIASEEFSGSPLFRLKNLNWLTSMNAREMAAFAISLDQKLRTSFVACLTPSRVNAMVASTENSDDKKQILSVLKDLDTVSDKDINEGLTQISVMFEKQKQAMSLGQEQKRRGLDTAKYMAQLAERMSPEEKDLLMQEIRSDEDLTKRMRDHIFPFDAVSLLPKELTAEIFTARTDLQIAQILFSADEKVRKVVMGVLPEIRRENVLSELSLFEGNKVYAKRYQKTSLMLQAEISKYLLGLYQEGILDLDSKANASVVDDFSENGTKNVA